MIKRWLGIPINHVVEVNFEDFPQLIDAMGGVDYTGGCIISRLDGGFCQGGYTLRLRAGTHHIDGRQALAIARTRENLCAANETDLQREEHQQALFTVDEAPAAVDVELLPSALDRLERAAGDHLRHERTDPAGAVRRRWRSPARRPRACSSRPARSTLPDGAQGLTVSEAQKRAAVARFMSG